MLMTKVVLIISLLPCLLANESRAICSPKCHKDHGYCEKPGECKCRIGWQGQHCDQCVPYPGCEHGSCSKPYECICEVGWGGIFCNTDLNYCMHHKPCRNGGTCTNTADGNYMCVCPEGFMGSRCEVEIDDCERKPCFNGGTCENTSSGSYRCRCAYGFSGPQCKNKANFCDSNPCQNGGMCVDLKETYKCVCKDGYKGQNCETDTNECSSGPCENEGPYFKKSPVSTVKAYVGDRVRLKCDVRGHPRPFLHWYKGSKLIKHTQSVSISGNTLTIRSVRGEDGGNYACNAQNPIGEIWGNVSLIVHLRQRPIIEGPTNQTVLVGQPLVLTCKDILDDHMTNLKWVKHYKVHGLYTALDGKPYVTVVQTVDETRNPEKFSIDNVTMDDAGWYTCIAENTFGVSYKSAYVEVLPGQISDTVENQNATIPNQQLELGLVHQQLDALNSTLMRVVSEQSRMRSVISRLVKQAKLKDRKTSRSRRKGRKGKGRLKRNRRPVLN